MRNGHNPLISVHGIGRVQTARFIRVIRGIFKGWNEDLWVIAAPSHVEQRLNLALIGNEGTFVRATQIGAGEAGSIVANLATDAGHRVAMIYRPPYGSTCLNTGCVPSKFLIHRARIAWIVRTAGRFHVRSREPRVDLRAIIDEKNQMIAEHRAESLQHARDATRLELIEGPARFRSSREVEAGGRTLRAKRIFIAAGMRPLVPPIPGLDSVPFLTSDSLMNVRELPRRLIVIGGGYVGCELGQAFHRFGAEVVMIDKGRRLLDNEERDVSTALAQAFTAQGMRVLLGQQVERIERAGSQIRVKLRTARGRTQTVAGTHLLIAAGRRPNTDGLALHATGVAIDKKGFVKVNEYLETNVPGIWAIGDVNGQQPFTRICQEEAKVAYENAFEDAKIPMQRLFLPHAVFTDPEIGSVGLTERKAREQGYEVESGLVTWDQVAKARLISETAGFIKFVADRRTRRVLGCHVIGPAAADLVYTAAVVIRHWRRPRRNCQSCRRFSNSRRGHRGRLEGGVARLRARGGRGAPRPLHDKDWRPPESGLIAIS